jgi:hypothetical protein
MDWVRGSVHPPPDVDRGDAVADPPKGCLLDRRLFLGDRTNATTAWYDHPGDEEIDIQVTLFVAPPPRVSYLLAFCSGTFFTEQPMVVAKPGREPTRSGSSRASRKLEPDLASPSQLVKPDEPT